MLLAAGGEGDPAWADPAHPIVVEPNDHYPGDQGAGTSISFRLEPGPATALSLSPVEGTLAARLGDRRDRRSAVRGDGRPERDVPLRLRVGVRGRSALDRLRGHAPQRARGGKARRRDPGSRPRARNRGGARMTTVRSVTPISVRYPEPNDNGAIRHLTLCRIEASDGTVGWGEAVTSWPDACRATEAVIDGVAHELVVGRDPLDNVDIWRSCKRRAWWYGNHGGISSFALSAIDIALWDLKGKLLGVPVTQLLGGAHHERLPAVASTHPRLASLEAEADRHAGLHHGPRVPGVQVRAREEGRRTARLGDRARRRVHATPARAGRARADADVGSGREHPHVGRRLCAAAHDRTRGARPDVDGGALRADRPRCVSTAEVALLDADRLGRARVERRGIPSLHRRRASPT